VRLVRRSLFVLVAVVLVVGVVLISASVLSYHNLTAETLIAEITFEPAGEQRYIAYLRTGDRCEERPLAVLGDQWRIDAAFLKWKYWAAALGLDAQYRLERFEGRYKSTVEQNTRPTLAHEIGTPTALDIASLAEALGPLNFLVDATYGTSTYQDIDTEHVFYVYRGPTGIFTRSEPRPAGAATPAGLPIAVTRACAQPPGAWQRFATWTDEAVRDLAALVSGRDG
jgi:hypothetical protein